MICVCNGLEGEMETRLTNRSLETRHFGSVLTVFKSICIYTAVDILLIAPAPHR